MRYQCRAFADRLLEEGWGRLWGLPEDCEGEQAAYLAESGEELVESSQGLAYEEFDALPV